MIEAAPTAVWTISGSFSMVNTWELLYGISKGKERGSWQMLPL